MNKSELAAMIAKAMSSSKVEAETFLNVCLDTISDTLTQGGTVTLVGFGAFDVLEQPERKGRNPQTGETILIPPRRKVRFKPGKPLKDKVNG